MESPRISIKNIDSKEVIVHYREKHYDHFDIGDAQSTTLLMSGLTFNQDSFITSAFKGYGYNVMSLDVPDVESFNKGKEFGNRGQCNPTYFTVGNLVKYLVYLRDTVNIPTDEIIKKYVFITAGACGPCRFGSYITEYRKALRDSGFEGFRVLVVSQTNGAFQKIGTGNGLKSSATFYLAIIKAIIIGDIVNILGYRIRPYELVKGETNQVIANVREIISDAFVHRKSLTRALKECRELFSKIKVDRSIVKPKVAIIGEFWAMTTEGDGSYRLQEFLESEGAEVDIQPVTGWLQYLFWQKRFDASMRADLNGKDNANKGLQGKFAVLEILKSRVSERLLKSLFYHYSKSIGLQHYYLSNMDEVAGYAHKYYNNSLRGGEGHMEIGKVILNAIKNKVTMTLSVKPFGCMPSSGVSDGVQSLVSEIFPNSIFLPIETTGDGKVGVYSRIQMMLFKAKKVAQSELEENDARNVHSTKCSDALYWPKSTIYATTAATILRCK